MTDMSDNGAASEGNMGENKGLFIELGQLIPPAIAPMGLGLSQEYAHGIVSYLS